MYWGIPFGSEHRPFGPIPSGFQGRGVRGGRVTKSHTKTRAHQKRHVPRLQIRSSDGGVLRHVGSVVFLTTADAQKT